MAGLVNGIVLKP